MKKYTIFMFILLCTTFLTRQYVVAASEKQNEYINATTLQSYPINEYIDNYLTGIGDDAFKNTTGFNDIIDLIKMMDDIMSLKDIKDLISILDDIPISLKDAKKLISILRDIFPKQTVKEIIKILIDIMKDSKNQDSMICIPKQTLKEDIKELINAIIEDSKPSSKK